MEQIDIGIFGGRPLTIKKGFPPRYKSRKFYNATCYHVEVEKGEYIFFQHIQVGPFACWYTEYLFNNPKILYCHMTPSGVEFHCMIEGSAMYNLDNDHKWFIESEGTHNILVNAPRFIKTAFGTLPVRTFDIHIALDHFKELMNTYPAFKTMLPAIESGQTGTLFTNKEAGALSLRYKISQVLLHFTRQDEATVNDEKQQGVLMQQLGDIIASFGQAENASLAGFEIRQAEIDTLLHIKSYIQENFMDSQVLADARAKYPMSPKRLIECFMALFNQKPKEFLIAEKIQRAKIFIQNNPTASRQEIAMSVGYLDAKYLNSLFIKREHLSIEQYRKQLQ